MPDHSGAISSTGAPKKEGSGLLPDLMAIIGAILKRQGLKSVCFIGLPRVSGIFKQRSLSTVIDRFDYFLYPGTTLSYRTGSMSYHRAFVSRKRKDGITGFISKIVKKWDGQVAKSSGEKPRHLIASRPANRGIPNLC